MSTKRTIALIPVLLLSACDWVDSTGRSGNSAPVTTISFADGEQSDTSQLNELSSLVLSVNANDRDGNIDTFQWLDEPVNQGRLAQCEAFSDYNPDYAADSLNEACASDANCRVIIRQEVTESDAVGFLVSAPKLKANVGVEFELTATDNEGGVGRQRSTFCLVAINEAPDAVADSFTVLEGETLNVSASDVNLLSNDSDDEHVGNAGELRVLPEPRITPSLSGSLVLNEDGGFTYEASPLPNNGAELAVDTFVYTVTDGTQTSDGSVSIRILARNSAPELISEIPVQQVVAGVPFSSDLSSFFEDEEGATLSFALVDGSLPTSGGLTLASNGTFSGTAETPDIGAYVIRIAASDGSEFASASLTINVAPNLPVEAQSIAAQSVEAGETLLLDVSESFNDPENQPLEYSVTTGSNDAELVINATTGILQGDFLDEGSYTIDVSASDGITPASTIRFIAIVTSDNVAPTFRGSILDQLVELGDSIVPVAGAFTDADDDDLTFSTLGTLPIGVTLNRAGILSGTPTQAGEFENIRIVATDPLGGFARTNAFDIVVVGVPARPVNSAPVFADSDSVFNQGIPLGAPIRPVEAEFTDADGDVLTYRVIGAALPDGVVLNRRTGVVSGTPTTAEWVTGLVILATDPSGASAMSDEFWIRVQ